METILLAVFEAPSWVYVLLVYLVITGIKALKTHIVSLQKLFILPFIFSVLSISSLMTDLKLSGLNIGIWLLTSLMGILTGWTFVKRLEIQVDKKQRLIEMQGTCFPLAIMLIIFASKYYFGYQLAVKPFLSEDVTFQFGMVSISGLCVGLLLGRLLCILKRFQIEGHVNLKKA
jgi:hypothetical protein